MIIKVKAGDYKYAVVADGTAKTGREWAIFNIKIDYKTFGAFSNEWNEELQTKAKAGENIEFYAVVKYELVQSKRTHQLQLAKKYEIVDETDEEVASDIKLETLEARIIDLEGE